VAAVETVSPFHTALAARREDYNVRFRLARHRSRTLDPDVFLAHLRDVVGPVVDAGPSDLVTVCDALVDLSFALAARGQLTDPSTVDALRRLPSLASFVAADPRRVPVAVVNAVHHLAASPTGDPARWFDTLTSATALLEPSDVDGLLAVGAVAAWRWGLAPLRASALDTARHLRPELLRAALRVESTVDVSALAADPWRAPDRAGSPQVVLIRRVGEFRGFGGAFLRPPIVTVSNGQWFATDGESAWRVYADRYGVGFRRVGEAPEPSHGDGDLTLAAGEAALPELAELAEATSWAAHGNTLAATTPWTHAILFLARTSG
jgi:hypothetical protein